MSDETDYELLTLTQFKALRADLDGARRQLEEARELIRLCTKYVVEDRAATPGLTRLARWVDKARAFLSPPAATPPLAGTIVFTSGDGVRLRNPGVASSEPAPPPCASWCGSEVSKGYHDEWEGTHWLVSGRCYCTLTCRDAGAPRNPEKPCELLAATGYTCATSGLKSRCPSCTPGAKLGLG